MEPVVEDPKDPSLWFIFKDATSNKEAYGGGRFLYLRHAERTARSSWTSTKRTTRRARSRHATCPSRRAQNLAAGPRRSREKAFAGGHHAP